MLLHPNIELTISEMDNLFPNQTHDSLKGKAEEVLHSHLIIGFEVPPLSWTPKHLCFRSPRCRRNAPHTRLSSGGR